MEITYKYTKSFRNVVKNIMYDDLSCELIDIEDENSDNIIDVISDKTKFLKCLINNHVQEIRCGKVIRKLLPSATNIQVERFVNKFKSSIFESTFDIVSGDDIRKYYKKDIYVPSIELHNTLHGSCMNDKSDDFFDIYCGNNVRLIILTDNKSGKLLGRALLWDGVNDLDDVSVMDIPYTAFQFLKDKFKDFAEKNNFFYTDDLGSEKLFFRLNMNNLVKYPYLDTFSMLEDNSILSNKSLYNNSDEFVDGMDYKELCMTNGEYSEVIGDKYYDDFDDKMGKYTFMYDSISKCIVDNRYYKKENIVNGMYKGYISLYENIFNNINRITEFDDDDDDKLTKLFIYKINKSLSRYIDKTFYSTEFVCNYNSVYKILDSRKREIIFPIEISNRTSYKQVQGLRNRANFFLKLRLMSSGVNIDIVEIDYINISEHGYKINVPRIGESIYKNKSKSMKDLFNNKIFEILNDIRLVTK